MIYYLIYCLYIARIIIKCSDQLLSFLFFLLCFYFCFVEDMHMMVANPEKVF